MKAISSKVLRQTLLASAVLSSFTLADLALAAEMTPMKPGVYTQKVVAHNGFMEVEVKLSADRIEAVKIVKSDETPYIVDEPMKQVISAARGYRLGRHPVDRRAPSRHRRSG